MDVASDSKTRVRGKKNRFPTLEPITSPGHCWRLGFDCGHQPQLLGTSPWNFFPLPLLSLRTRTWIIWDINCTAVENCVNPGKPKRCRAYCWLSSQKPAFVLSYGYDCLRLTGSKVPQLDVQGAEPRPLPCRPQLSGLTGCPLGPSDSFLTPASSPLCSHTSLWTHWPEFYASH